MPEKIRSQSADMERLNYQRLVETLSELFPSCVVERIRAQQEPAPKKQQGAGAAEASATATPKDAALCEHAINWQALGSLIGEHLSATSAEAGVGVGERGSFGFVWPGKTEAVREAMRSLDMSLRPLQGESLNWDTTANLYIEGDNLTALKLLQNSYLGKVKMIYIDPPYNTGNKTSFVYNDDFAQKRDEFAQEAGLIDEETGARLVSNPQTEPRYHSLWCSMIYARLLVARSLLRRDGVIFISIDDHEQHHLRDICDEIFGERNFIAQLVWQRTSAAKNDAKYVSTSHDYILMYARSLDDFTIGRLPMSEELRSSYTNPDNDPRGPWKSDNFSVKTYSKSCDYPITTPAGKVFNPPKGRCWMVRKERYEELLKDKRMCFGQDGQGAPTIKRFLSERKREGMTPTSMLLGKDVGFNTEGTKELKKIMDAGVFDGPKPVRLIRHLMALANLDPKAGDIVLDFFSGSATTAEAVMRANAEDGGERRFILIQLPEECAQDTPAAQEGYHNICQIGKERMRRVAALIAPKLSNMHQICAGGGVHII